MLRDPLAETSGILPGEYRFGWFSMPILLAVAIVAFVAPLETLWVELIGFVVTIVVSRIAGAALWIRLHGSEDFAAVAGRCFVRDALGIAGLLIVVWCGLALGVYVLMPAVGFGSAHSYVQALEPGGPGNPFPSIHQTAVFIHLFWLLPAVLTAAVVLMRPVGDLERPLVLPRMAKAINSRTLTVRLGLAGALIAVSGLLVVLTGGLSPTHLPSGASCAITPITCNAIKLASISGEHRTASPARHNVPGSSKHQRATGRGTAVIGADHSTRAAVNALLILGSLAGLGFWSWVFIRLFKRYVRAKDRGTGLEHVPQCPDCRMPGNVTTNPFWHHGHRIPPR